MDYQVIRSVRKSVGLQVKDGKVIVKAPVGMTDSEIDVFVHSHRAWIEKHMAAYAEASAGPTLSREDILELAQQALEIIPKRVAHYAALVGVSYGRITIRDQRTKWGSCSDKGNLNFNCLLMLAPKDVLDAIVVHELCHRIEMNHSPKFYAEVYRVFPKYDECHKWLKDNGDRLMAMLPK